MPTTLRVPFQLEGNRLGVESDPVEIAKQKIITVLMTTPPERIHLPAFGAGTPAWLMEGVDDLVIQDFAAEAALEVAGRVSGVTIHAINLVREDVTTVSVLVQFSTPLSAIQTVSVTLDADILLTEDTPV